MNALPVAHLLCDRDIWHGMYRVLLPSVVNSLTAFDLTADFCLLRNVRCHPHPRFRLDTCLLRVQLLVGKNIIMLQRSVLRVMHGLGWPRDLLANYCWLIIIYHVFVSTASVLPEIFHKQILLRQ